MRTVYGIRGTAALYSHKAKLWYLVPSISNGCGGRNYDWDKVLPGSYATKREALAARKLMREAGQLP